MQKNEEFSRRLNEYLKSKQVSGKDDFQKVVDEFMKLYNNGQLDDGYEDTPEAKSQALLDKAINCKQKSRRISLLKEAIALDPRNVDAKLELLVAENSHAWEILPELDKVLAEEEAFLEKDNYFKEDMGHFYGLVETRPYMRALANKVDLLKVVGQIPEAIRVAERILELNENDNLGIRYTLMGLYAWMCDKEKALALKKKYPEESISMLLPFALVCFRYGDYRKCKSTLTKVQKLNSNTLDILLNLEDYPDDQDTYQPNGDDEVAIACHSMDACVYGTPAFLSFILDQFPEIRL